MAAAVIGSVWAAGSWEDTCWESDSWDTIEVGLSPPFTLLLTGPARALGVTNTARTAVATDPSRTAEWST